MSISTSLFYSFGPTKSVRLVCSCRSPIEILPRWRTGEGSPDMASIGYIHNTQGGPKSAPLPCGEEGTCHRLGEETLTEN